MSAPTGCIYIDSHKEASPPAAPGGRERSRNVLDRFAIDFSLCMYCGICIECAFDALFWSPEFEYAETDIHELTHERDKLREWMWTVPEPPALDPAAEEPKEIAAARKAADKLAAQRAKEQQEQQQQQKEQQEQQGEKEETRDAARRPVPGHLRRRRPPRLPLPSGVEIAFLLVGLATLGAAVITVTTRQLVHAALWLVVALGGLAVEYLLLTAEFIAWVQVLIYVGSIVVLLLFGLMLTRAPIGRSPDADSGNRWVALGVALASAAALVWVVVDAFRTTWIDLDGPAQGSTRVTGAFLFRNWVLPFEALSVLLLAALVGAIVLSRKRDTETGTGTRQGRGHRQGHRHEQGRGHGHRRPHRPVRRTRQGEKR